MKPTRRRFRGDADYWRIREFLRTVFRLNDRRELAWQVYRFDYWRWHGVQNLGHGRLTEDVFLWELPDRRAIDRDASGHQIVAVLHPEGPGHVNLQLHPLLRTPDLESEMLSVAEEHWARQLPRNRRRLTVWANSQDEIRQSALRQRGYTRGDQAEHQRWRPLQDPIPDAPLAEGYLARALGGVEELPARSLASWRAFHPDEPDDRYEGWEWYRNIQRAPLYRRDLDLVAVASDGEIASFCTIWFDDVSRTGAFEPVGTASSHQRQGLGRAVMTEGLRRLQALGATRAYVGSYSPAAHALYASVGFTEHELSEPWAKML